MNIGRKVILFRGLPAILLILPVFSFAQTPVDEDGNVIGTSRATAEIMPLGEPFDSDGIPHLDALELEKLVGPVALYPDDLLAIVLPASAYPLQIAAAARFLESLEENPNLQPPEDWDDSVVALINYPEIVELLNNDLDWTYQLGEAVVSQQADVISAIESFRDRAYAAGNLKSDDYQTVSRASGTIEISPAEDDAIYVPYYEPERVVTYQVRPAYYYYPRPRPVYYYPYAADHYFDRGFFWGVTTAFSIGWVTDSLHVHHHSYRSHPYYGRSYWNDYWWYRRPSVTVYNTTYVRNTNVVINRNYHDYRGDRWRARDDRDTMQVRNKTAARERTSELRHDLRSARQTQREQARPQREQVRPQRRTTQEAPVRQARATQVRRSEPRAQARRTETRRNETRRTETRPQPRRSESRPESRRSESKRSESRRSESRSESSGSNRREKRTRDRRHQKQ